MAALAVSGAVSFLLLIPYARFAVRFLARLDYRVVNIGTLIIIVAVLLLTTGFDGIADRHSGDGDRLDPIVLRHTAHELPRRAAGADHVEHGRRRSGYCEMAGVGLKIDFARRVN